MKKVLLGLVLTFGLMSFCSYAGEVWWGGGDGVWGNSANWGGGSLPGVTDQACINSTVSPYPTLSSGDYTIYDLLDGYWNDGGMTLSGGSLTINDVFAVGYKGALGVTSNAAFTMNGGTISALYQWVGYSYDAAYPINGTFTISSGLVNVTYTLNVGGGAGNTVGQLNLNGGEIDLGNFSTINIASGSKITVSGSGKLRIYAGGEKTKVVSYVENGQIVAGAGYKLKVSFGPTAPISIEAVSTGIVDPNEMWWGTSWQIPAGGNGNWAFPGNWGRGYVPGTTDQVFINNSSETTPSFPVISSGAQVASNVSIGTWSNGKLTVSGGSLTVVNNITVADRGDGILNISGGSVTTTAGAPWYGCIKVGYKGTYGASGNGDVNMTGGTLNVTGNIEIGLDAGGYGAFNLNGGVINGLTAWNSSINVGRWGPGEMTMNGGTANITGLLAVAPGSDNATLVLNNGDITGPLQGGAAGVPQVRIGYHESESLAHGKLDMYGGSITSSFALRIGWYPWSTGELNIYGGTYTHACDLFIDNVTTPVADSTSKINLAGGQLIIQNLWRTMDTVYNQLVAYKNSGQLVAFGGGANTVLHIDKNVPAAGQITVWGENLAAQAKASNPVPVDGDTVYKPVTLQWLQGIDASTQNIYVGTDRTIVTDATTASPEWRGTFAGTVASYIPTIVIGQTYYWRIDTIKSDLSVVKGSVWSFTLGDYIVLEDCQSYTGTLSNWAANGTGSVALDTDTSDLGYKWGYQHGQAVVFNYNNTASGFDEAIYTMPAAFNANAYNSASLWIDIHGDPANVGSTEPLYVILEDSTGHRSQAVMYSRTGASKDLIQENWENWYRWSVALSDFTASGFDFASVKKVIIRVGGSSASGASGKILIDDIRIYPPLCTADHILGGDFTYDCAVDMNDLEMVVRDWLMGPTTVTASVPAAPILWYKFNETTGSTANDAIGSNHGTLRNGPTWVAGGGPDGSNCIKINGGRTDGTYGVSVPATVFAGITDTISFSVWVKGDASQPVSPTGDVFCGSSVEADVWDGPNPSTKIYFQCPFEAGNVAFGCGWSNGSFDNLPWNDAFVNDWRGVWVHYACVKDGTAETMSIYRNGELVSTLIEGAAKPISGVNYFWVGATQKFGYAGSIDDFRIYNYALSPQQVVSLANKTSVTQPILNWRADANSDGVVGLADFAAMAQKWIQGEQLWPHN